MDDLDAGRGRYAAIRLNLHLSQFRAILEISLVAGSFSLKYMPHTQKHTKIRRITLGMGLALSFFSAAVFAGDAFSSKNGSTVSGAETGALSSRIERLERELIKGVQSSGAPRNKQASSLNSSAVEEDLRSVGAALLGELNQKYLVRHERSSFLLSEAEVSSFVERMKANKTMAERFGPPMEMAGASNSSLKIPPPPQGGILSNAKKADGALASTAAATEGKPKPAEPKPTPKAN